MKVLIADDDPVSRRLLASAIGRWGYEAIIAQDGNEAMRALLARDAPKLAILDWRMPGMDGTELCREIRQQKPEPYTYIILLTSKNAQDDLILGLEAGADDYLTKPFDPAELKVRLWTGKRIVYLQDQLISSREVLRYQATRDHLTDLLNRASILGLLGDELVRATREAKPLGVVIADIDHFKNINDTFGHQTGDQVLRHVASIMRKSTRCYDYVGRYGGEEFLMVLPGCGISETETHANRVREAVSSAILQPPTIGIRTTLSLGVAIAEVGANVDVSTLINAADQALYKAKYNGRNRAEVDRSDNGQLSRFVNGVAGESFNDPLREGFEEMGLKT